MALKLENGRYVKISLETCYATPRGMYVSYNLYSNEDVRALEKEKLKLISKFKDKVFLDICSKRESVEKYLIENNIKTEEEFKDAPEEIKDTVKLLETIDFDIEKIENKLYKKNNTEEVDLSKLENYAYLKSMGFSLEWYKNQIEYPTTITRISSPYTGQKFTYDDMYKELKKIFKKEGYTDC